MRVAVRRALRHRAGADGAAGAAAVVDDDLLAEDLAHLVGDGAADDRGRAAGRERDDQRDRPVRIGLRGGRSERAADRQRGQDRGQRQSQKHRVLRRFLSRRGFYLLSRGRDCRRSAVIRKGDKSAALALIRRRFMRGSAPAVVASGRLVALTSRSARRAALREGVSDLDERFPVQCGLTRSRRASDRRAFGTVPLRPVSEPLSIERLVRKSGPLP